MNVLQVGGDPDLLPQAVWVATVDEVAQAAREARPDVLVVVAPDDLAALLEMDVPVVAVVADARAAAEALHLGAAGAVVQTDDYLPLLWATIERAQTYDVDITDPMTAALELQSRLVIEELLVDITGRFVTAFELGIDGEIYQTLADLGEFLGVDRAFLNVFSGPAARTWQPILWHAEGLQPQTDNVEGFSIRDFPWVYAQLIRGEMVSFDALDELPPDAASARQLFEAMNIRSLIEVPMLYQGELVGLIGFSTERQTHHWTGAERRLLLVLSRILVSALMRQRAEAFVSRRLAIEELIGDLSTTILAGLDNLEQPLHYALRAIGHFTRADRAFADVLAADQEQIQHNYEWTREGIADHSAIFEGLPLTSYAWLMEQMQAGQTVTINSLDEVPAEAAAERELWIRLGVKSALLVPLMNEGRLIGMFGLSAERHAIKWAPEDVRMLRLFSEILVHALARRATQEALRKSETRYRIIAENASDLITQHALDGTNLYISPSVVQVLGYEAHQLNGINPFVNVHPDDVARVQAAHATALQSAASIIETYRIQHRDGHYIWLETVGRAVRDAESGAPSGILTLSRDVTERIQSEMVLRIQRDMIAAMSLSNTVPEALGHLLHAALQLEPIDGAGIYLRDLPDPDYVLIMHRGVSDEFVKAVERIEHDDLLARRLARGLHIYYDYPDDARADIFFEREGVRASMIVPVRVDDEILAVLAVVSHQHHEFSLLIRHTLDALAVQSGTILGRIYAEQALRESELRLRMVLRNYPDGVVMLFDEELKFLLVDGSFLRDTGMDPAMMVGQAATQIMPASHQARVEPILRAAFDGTHTEGEVTINERTVLLRVAPIHDDGGRVVSGLAIGQDITGRKLAELERERMIDDLAAFDHMVAHDLKNPLNMILAYGELLGEMLEDDDLLEIAATISRTAHDAFNIIDELLQLAELRKRGELDVEPLEMGLVVEGALKRLRHMIDTADATIVVSAQWASAYGHAPWVEAVWVNYISNAIKYGGDPPHVVLGCDDASSDEYIRFWVQDNGQGLTPDEQAQLFNQFVRLDRVRAEGHGLGLSIVKRIVDRLGGQVGVQSEKGHGSTFFFTLPRNNSSE